MKQALVHHEDHVEVLDLANCSLLQNVSIDIAGWGSGRENFPLCPFGVVSWLKTKHIAWTSDQLISGSLVKNLGPNSEL